MTRTILACDAQDAPQELHHLLRALAGQYPIVEAADKRATRVKFASAGPKGGLIATLSGGAARIEYDRPHHAARGLGAVLAGLVKPGRTYREQAPFETFGVMLDCSRNAVMTVAHFTAWLRQLALLGYNMAMLYTEDTYELAGEPFFGYLRGRYGPDELRRIDRCAAELGIEMIGCIQTLGHLEQVLKWPAYRGVRDTGGILLVDEDATYALIDKMVAGFAACYRSRRIHIGMDEAHDLGRGRFLDRFGYQRGYDIFNRHLARVVEICKRHGLRPMIWSDMYFRMGSRTGDYYDKDCHIPDDVKSAIPRECQLVYWDYYHDNPEFYADWIRRHRELGREPVMAGGVWTWGKLWHDRDNTVRLTAPCVQACKQAGVKELFFTMWGDDGGYCEFDSALAGLAYAAEAAYSAGQVDPRRLGRRFAAVCGGDYAATMRAGDLNAFGGPALLWDDPLLGIWWKGRRLADAKFWPKARAHFARLLGRLAPLGRQIEPVDFAHAANLAACLLAKVELGLALERAYAARNAKALRATRSCIPAMVRAIDAVLASFRRQWLRRNKPFGLETMQIRLGGLKQRYLELGARLADLAAGRTDSIPELDEQPGSAAVGWNYRSVASGSAIL